MYTLESSIVVPVVFLLLISVFIITFFVVQISVFEQLNGIFFSLSLREGSFAGDFIPVSEGLSTISSPLGTTHKFYSNLNDTEYCFEISYWKPNRVVFDIGKSFIQEVIP